jgi:hypothetical protein
MGRTLRFNKAYVDRLIQNRNKKLSWISPLLAVTNSFAWVVSVSRGDTFSKRCPLDLLY